MTIKMRKKGVCTLFILPSKHILSLFLFRNSNGYRILVIRLIRTDLKMRIRQFFQSVGKQWRIQKLETTVLTS